MSGEIGYKSELGHGSTFWFDLELAVRSARPPAASLGALPPGLSVLVVDDNARSREILLGQLRHLGVRAEGAADGREALARMRAGAAADEPFRFVLIDWDIPGTGSWQLAAEICADGSLGFAMPILLASTGPAAGPEAPGAAGFAALLTKPVREAALQRCLARVIGEPSGKPAAKAAPAASGSGARLLLAEDNPTNQVIAQRILTKMGHIVEIAVDGNAALERLERERFDAVLMDCEMPGLDGYETTRRIRAGLVPGLNPHIPIIAVTASVMQEDRRKCIDAGMDDFVTKPLRAHEVAAALRRAGLVSAC
jgi:CheY-like chemotaxis protein